MSRVKVKDHTVITFQCGNCGTMIPKSWMVNEKCKKCMEPFEP